MAEYVRTAIVTGANSGLGFETTKELAKQNIKVIMACRNLEKAEQAKNDILKEIPYANLRILELDLNSFESVRNFAEEFKSKYKALHLLINNAGFMAKKFELSKDGIETQYASNFLGHFLLTNLLLNRLKNSEDSRIISLASLAHKNGKIELEKVNDEKHYANFKRYSETKLACLIFSYELHRRLKSKKIQIASIATHPGVSITSFGNALPQFAQSVQHKIGSLFMSNQKQGAESIIFSALDFSAKGGDYYGPSGLFEIKGKPKKVNSTKLSKDEKLAQELWNFAEKVTGLKFEI